MNYNAGARRLETVLFALLAAGAAAFLFNESTFAVLDRSGKVRGRDFLQFYIAGRLAPHHDAGMYNHARFFALQQQLLPVDELNPRYYPLYPPTVALAFIPLARLPYERAIEIWWLIQTACLLAAGKLLINLGGVPPQQRRLGWLILATFYPAWLAILNGQLSPLLLLVVTLGLSLRQRSSSTPAQLLSGLVLSCLALKPQLAALVMVWLALRLDWRTAFGFAAGLGAQFGAVAWILGWEAWRDYAQNLGVYSQLSGIYRFTPDYEQSLSGILINLFGPQRAVWFKTIHLLVAMAAAVGLWRIVHAERSAAATRQRPVVREHFQAKELAGVVLFCLLGTPHLLVYDLSLLLAPIALLHRIASDDARADRMALALYGSAMLTPVFGWLGASIMPVVLLLAIARLGAATSSRVEQFAHLGEQVIGGVGLGKQLDRSAPGM